MKSNVISASLISISIIISAFLLSGGTKSEPVTAEDQTPKNPVVQEETILLDIDEAAMLLGIPKQKLKNIIVAEKIIIDKYNNFSGTRLPYLVIDEEYYFSKASLSDWIYDATLNIRKYKVYNMEN